jgi:hypothetical protein
LDLLTNLLQAYVNGAAASGTGCGCERCCTPPAYFPPLRSKPSPSRLTSRELEDLFSRLWADVDRVVKRQRGMR